MTDLAFRNLLAYNAQLMVVAAAGALASRLFRMRHAGVRLAYWRLLLAVCLALPLMQPWAGSVVTAGRAVPAAAVPAPQPAPAAPVPATLPWRDLVLGVLAAGAAGRAAWLGIGLWRLSRKRRAAQPWFPVPGDVGGLQLRLFAFPELLISEDVTGPVTFHGTVLLPPQFLEMPPRAQYAVVCHELLHVARRDWLWTLAEECLRAVLWFQPAVWWVLGEIQLAREQSVDREVLRLTAREPYLDALLSMSGVRQADLAPAPLFFKRGHLTARVAAMLEEAKMTKRWLWAPLAASCAVLACVVWLAAASFPLRALPRQVTDAAGVAIEAGDANLIHRAPVEYPSDARAKGIQGTVAVEAQIADDGTVANATVLNGPIELSRAVLASVLQWHWSREMAGRRLEVRVRFETEQTRRPPPHPPETDEPAGTLGDVRIRGLSQAAAEQLFDKLALRKGDVLTREGAQRVEDIVREFDAHLLVSLSGLRDGLVLTIMAPPPPPRVGPEGVVGGVPGGAVVRRDFPPPGPGGSQRIRVGAAVQERKLVRRVEAQYPPLAKQARIQGAVRLSVVVGAEGRVTNIGVLSGHPLLVPAALDAVRQWEYAPTLLNGNPVDVLTEVEVPFTLPPGGGGAPGPTRERPADRPATQASIPPSPPSPRV
ncbi:MAG: TonB family protein [Bryobacteraceae bacterium]